MSVENLDALLAEDTPDICDFLNVQLGSAQTELDNLDQNGPDFHEKKKGLEIRIMALWSKMKEKHCDLNPP